MSEEITDAKRFRAIRAIAESYTSEEGTMSPHPDDLTNIEQDAVQVIADMATIARICREAAEAGKRKDSAAP